MNEFKKYLFSIVILGTCFGGMTLLILMKQKPGTEDPTELIPTVSTYAAQPFLNELDLEVSGLVVPFREIKLPALVKGKVVKKTKDCEAGNWVKKDTILFEIEKIDYQIEIDRLMDELTLTDNSLHAILDEIWGAEDILALAKEEQANYQREFDRREGLGSAISKSDMDLASRNLINAKKTVASLKNSLFQLHIRQRRLETEMDLAETDLAKANLNYDRTTIKAPFDGVIVREMVEKGGLCSGWFTSITVGRHVPV